MANRLSNSSVEKQELTAVFQSVYRIAKTMQKSGEAGGRFPTPLSLCLGISSLPTKITPRRRRNSPDHRYQVPLLPAAWRPV